MARRLLVLLIVSVMSLGLSFNALAQGEVKKIGIVMLSNLPHYEAALKGIQQQLLKEGFNESNLVVDVRDAGGKKEMVTEIAKEFKAEGVDLIMPIGTPAAVPVYKEIKDIPIVFSTVFDPIGSGLAESWESSGTNTTGSSTWVEMSAILTTLRKILPFKTLGVVYTKEENHSVIQMEECKKLQEQMGFEVIAVNQSKIEDAEVVANSLVGKVEAIYDTASTPINKSMGVWSEITIKAKIPMASHLQERVKLGTLLAVSTNSTELGELAGKKAGQVLRGTSPSNISIERGSSYEIALNLKVAKELGIEIPGELILIAAKLVKE